MSRPAVTTAVDAVAADLRARILDGDLPPGARLREEELSAGYEVARHTARAALRSLAAQRLVVVEPHRGARVAALDGDDLRALFELRTALEVEAARLLLERAAPAASSAASAADGSGVGWPPEVERAARALQDACAAAAADPPDRRPRDDPRRTSLAAVDAAHAALHHALVAAAGSPRITEAHAALDVESRVVLLHSRPALPPQRMAAMHADLLDRLPREGPEALRRHLREGAAAATPDRR